MTADRHSSRARCAAVATGRAVAACAVAALFAFRSGGAGAEDDRHMDHYGPGHWYPTECCSRMDCRPIPDSAVKLTPTGWLVLDTEEVIPFGHRKERRSMDGAFHRCSLAFRPNARPDTKDRTICLFVPGQVM